MNTTRPDIAFAEIVADLAQSAGLSRPAGLCLAGVWRAAQAPCADDLVAGLGLSRSNVSTALKELRGWGLVGIARTPGDRKEYFTAPADPWELLRLVLVGRERRLIAPALDRMMAAEAATGDVRLAALHDMLAQVGQSLAGLGRAEAGEVQKAFAGFGAGPEKPKKKKKKH